MKCRLCGNLSDLTSVFDHRFSITQQRYRKFCVLLATGVQIREDDIVSKMVCHFCCELVEKIYKYRINAVSNDKLLKEELGEPYVPPVVDVETITRTNSASASIPSVMNDINLNLCITPNHLNAMRSTCNLLCEGSVSRNVVKHASVTQLIEKYPTIKLPNQVFGCDINPLITIDKDEVTLWQKEWDRRCRKILPSRDITVTRVHSTKTNDRQTITSASVTTTSYQRIVQSNEFSTLQKKPGPKCRTINTSKTEDSRTTCNKTTKEYDAIRNVLQRAGVTIKRVNEQGGCNSNVINPSTLVDEVLVDATPITQIIDQEINHTIIPLKQLLTSVPDELKKSSLSPDSAPKDANTEDAISKTNRVTTSTVLKTPPQINKVSTTTRSKTPKKRNSRKKLMFSEFLARKNERPSVSKPVQIKATVPTSEPPLKELFVCRVCFKVFDTITVLNNHQMDHLRCRYCQVQIPNYDQLKFHETQNCQKRVVENQAVELPRMSEKSFVDAFVYNDVISIDDSDEEMGSAAISNAALEGNSTGEAVTPSAATLYGMQPPPYPYHFIANSSANLEKQNKPLEYVTTSNVAGLFTDTQVNIPNVVQPVSNSRKNNHNHKSVLKNTLMSAPNLTGQKNCQQGAVPLQQHPSDQSDTQLSSVTSNSFEQWFDSCLATTSSSGQNNLSDLQNIPAQTYIPYCSTDNVEEILRNQYVGGPNTSLSNNTNIVNTNLYVTNQVPHPISRRRSAPCKSNRQGLDRSSGNIVSSQGTNSVHHNGLPVVDQPRSTSSTIPTVHNSINLHQTNVNLQYSINHNQTANNSALSVSNLHSNVDNTVNSFGYNSESNEYQSHGRLSPTPTVTIQYYNSSSYQVNSLPTTASTPNPSQYQHSYNTYPSLFNQPNGTLPTSTSLLKQVNRPGQQPPYSQAKVNRPNAKRCKKTVQQLIMEQQLIKIAQNLKRNTTTDCPSNSARTSVSNANSSNNSPYYEESSSNTLQPSLPQKSLLRVKQFLDLR